MKKSTCFPSSRRQRPKLATVLLTAGLAAAPAVALADGGSLSASYNHNLTTSADDCVHGNTGASSATDCTRNRASRHTDDINASSTDSAYNDGNTAGMTPAVSEQRNSDQGRYDANGSYYGNNYTENNASW